KEIQCGDALREASLNTVPLGSRHQARQQIVREDALRALFAAINRKRDALRDKGEIGRLLAPLQLVRRQGGQRLGQCAVVLAHVAVRCAHLVEGLIERIVAEQSIECEGMADAHVFLESFLTEDSGWRSNGDSSDGESGLATSIPFWSKLRMPV